MKFITKSYYKNSKLFFYAGLAYAITVPSCIILWKNYNLEVTIFLFNFLN